MNNLITITSENFDNTITQNDMVVLDFWAEWCGPCKAFSKIYEQVAAKNPTVIFGKINTEEQTELAAEFNIRSIPTLMIMRKKVVLFAESGLLPEEALQDLINQANKLDMSEVMEALHPDDKK